MGRGKEVTEFQKGKIVALFQEGYSIRVISQKTGTPKSCIGRLLKRLKETGSVNAQKFSGRPSKLTTRLKQHLSIEVKRNPWINSNELAKLARTTGTNVKPRTVREWCQYQLKLRAYKPARKPLLSSSARLRRLKWCKEHKNWTYDNWKTVLFSDEAMFRQFGGRFKLYVRRPVNTRYVPRYTIPTVKKCDGLMIWGTMSAKGRGSLHFVPKKTTVNSDRYIKILEDKLQACMNIHQTTVFQHDMAPCHNSKKTNDWLRQRGIAVLHWPGNSPDLSPIENLWHLFKQRVAEHNPVNEKSLKDIIVKVWCSEITQQYCKRLVRSMPSRIQKVINCNGFATKY